MSAFVLSVLAVNIIFWAVLLIKFKRLFSTDDIIEDTRSKMNRMISDINSSADRDVFLTEESGKRLKKQIDEAEKVLSRLQSATETLKPPVSQTAPLSILSVSDDSRSNFGNARTKAQGLSAYQNQISPGSSYELVKQEQGELFSSQDSIINDVTNVTKDGAAYKEVPLIVTKVLDELPSSAEGGGATMEQRVRHLYDRGLTAETIAKELSCSVSEVELIIELNK